MVQKQTEAAFVKPVGRPEGSKPTYIEIFKSVTEKTDETRLNTDVYLFKKAKDGSLIIKLQKGSTAGLMVKSIREGQGAEVATSWGLGIVMVFEVRGLDGTPTKNEVKEAVYNELKGAEPKDFKIQGMRPADRDTQLAIVTVSKAAARILLTIGRLKIGYVYARVKGRLEIPRCYRCLGFGHIVAKCSNRDNGEKFFR